MDVERRWENWKSKRSMTSLWWSIPRRKQKETAKTAAKEASKETAKVAAKEGAKVAAKVGTIVAGTAAGQMHLRFIWRKQRKNKAGDEGSRCTEEWKGKIED